MTPAADTRHQDLVLFVAVQLSRHADRPGGGRVFVAPFDVVLSPTGSDPRHDRVCKRQLYARYGVEEHWIVDPDGGRVEVYRLADGRYPTPTLLEAGATLTTGLLPGLSIDVTELLAAGR